MWNRSIDRYIMVYFRYHLDICLEGQRFGPDTSRRQVRIFIGLDEMPFDTVWYSVIQCDTVWYSVIQCDTMWYSVIQCDTVWYSVIQCDTVWYSVLKWRQTELKRQRKRLWPAWGFVCNFTFDFEENWRPLIMSGKLMPDTTVKWPTTHVEYTWYLCSIEVKIFPLSFEFGFFA